MAAETHSFIDIAALDGVRRHFAAGDAVVVLTTNLDQIIWCNGPGAALLGFSGIEAAIGAEAGFSPTAKRQIGALPGYPDVGADRPVAVRLATRMTSQIIALRASSLPLPGGDSAIMLVSPMSELSPRGANEAAARAIGGFEEAGSYVALLGPNAEVLAATRGFERLGLGPRALETLVADVAAEKDRLLKRIVRTEGRALPVGFARLTDEPGRHLLIAVDEGGIDEQEPARSELPIGVVDDSQLPATARPTSTSGGDAATAAAQAEAQELPLAGGAAEDGAAAKTVASVKSEAQPASSDAATAKPEAETAAATQGAISPSEGPARQTQAASQHDNWYFSDRASAASSARGAGAQDRPAVERATTSVRFVWRTDAEGCFSSISPEFVAAVGPEASNIVGKSFADVANRLGLDPDGEIGGLLERRDTWSGRSVLWPIAGTELRVPVDLAALPAYGRDRQFEGFRGFGVVRGGEAIVDPDATGMALIRPQTVPAETGEPASEHEEPAAEADVPVAGVEERAAPPSITDPFKGEVPALEIAAKPQRRFSDKVIRLAEHRQPANDKGLTPVERNAFREIGEQLKRASETTPAAPAESKDDAKAEVAPAEARRDGREADQGPAEVASAADQSTVSKAGGETPVKAPAIGATPVRTVSATDAPEWRPPVTEVSEPPADLAGERTEPSVEAGVEGESPFRDAVSVETDGTQEVRAPQDEAGQATPAANDERRTADEPVVEATAQSVEEAPTAAKEGSQAEDATAEAKAEPKTPSANDVPPPDRVSRSLLDFAAAADNENIPGVEASVGGGVRVPNAGEYASAANGKDASASASDVASSVDEGTGAEARDRLEGTTPPSKAPRDTADQASHAAAEAPSDIGKDESQPLAKAEPHTPPPPLKQSGFLPSAFAERGEKRADTSILAQLPIPVLIHAGDTLHYANDAFFELAGYESIEQLAEAGGLDALLSGPAADRKDGDSRVMLRTRQGEEFPVSAVLQSVPWLGGKALLLTLTRQPAISPPPAVPSAEDQDLRARVAELRTILDTATDGVVLIGNDGNVSSISRPAEALFGYDSDQLVGKPFTSLFAIESQRAARDYLAGLTEHGVASVLNDGREVIGRESQGRFIPLFMTIGRLPGNGGYCAVLRDITQWKRAEEDLTQARAQAERTSTQKSDFLARVSHEIRTPLNAIIGFSELMLDEKFGPVANDRYRDYLRDINRSGNHVLDLVNDLLDISKIEAGQQEMDYEAVALNDALAETVAMMQPQANRERVIIRSSFASKLPEIVADLRSVRQIALNILSNAVRYTQAGGQVIVSTALEPNGEVVMRVRDTGIGMTQAEIEQALKPFKQVNALKRARGDGTGLGLPLTKAMVEANRAKFAIYSTPGEGTLVEVTFPSTRVLAE